MKKKMLVAAFALLGAMCLLLDRAPASSLTASPAAADVQASIDLINRIEAGRNREALYHWDSLHSATKLIAQSLGEKRLQVVAPRVKGDPARALISRHIGLGIWLNASLSIQDGTDTPQVEIQVGSVSFPPSLSRWIVERGLNHARLTHPALPSLSQMFRNVSILPEGVRAHLDLPMAMLTIGRDGGLAHFALAQAHVCTVLNSFESGKPIPLDILLNRTFAPTAPKPGGGRELLMALTMQALPTESARFLPPRSQPRAECLPAARLITLHHRVDLARHWLLSAALAANFGASFSNNVGYWKELSDSAPVGSGFSFIDLAADCSGTRWGSRLAGSAAAVAAGELQRITEAGLLPAGSLQLEEGLSEAEFNRRFGETDPVRCARDRYRQSLNAAQSARHKP